MKYDFETLKKAIQFNTVEVLPTDSKQLDNEIKFLIDQSEKSGEPIRHYIGFEISGQIHIGTGIMSGLKIAELQKAGVECCVWLADYHTWINGKLDGKIETIRKVSKEYFAPILKVSFELAGCDTSKIHFLSAEEEYKKQKHGLSFWDYDLMISQNITLSRVLKSISVTGKSAGNDVNFATLRYAPMQTADAFWLQTHIVHAGIDQRKCHVLMREVSPKLDYSVSLKLGGKPIKPIAVHHSLLHGLGAPESKLIIDEDGNQNIITETAKMSKSKPETCVFVHDSVEDIQKKLKKAYCPQIDLQNPELEAKKQKENPILNWCQNMIFAAGKTIQIIRPIEYGGNIEYKTYQELELDYLSGKIHPGDLKSGVAACLIKWFEPARQHIEKNPESLQFLQSILKSRKIK